MKKKGFFSYTLLIVVFYFPLFSQVTFSMTQPVSSEEHNNLFRATEEFKKLGNYPETPSLIRLILMETKSDGIARYEVMVVNN